MTSRAELQWRVLLIGFGGVTVGYALAGLGVYGAPSPFWLLAGAFLSGIASWLEVPLRPGGSVNFAPAVFLVFSVVFSFWAGIVLAGLAPLSWIVFRDRRRPISAILARGGQEAIVLALAVLGAKPVFAALRLEPGTLGSLLVLSTAFVPIDYLVRITQLSQQERIRIERLAVPLLSSSLPHYGFLVAAAVLTYSVAELIGPAGVFLTAIVFAEVYYPWKLLGEQSDLFQTSLQMIIEAVDLKDPYTSRHSQRVSNYAVSIARILSLPETEVEKVRIAGLMHDVGKIGISGSIIRKPSKLTESEMETMRSHAEVGANIISELGPLSAAGGFVLHHHEHYDGTGYPSRLLGTDIPMGSRIILVADAFDALITDRPYRRGRSKEEALKVLEAHSGTQFDPAAVEALKRVLIVQSRSGE